jgi:uncharacterized protein YjbJ (UPF0337 family)
MNSDIVQGKWNQLKGNIKAVFGKLTDDDLTQAQGSAAKMVRSLQERYGYTREHAQAQWNKFVHKYKSDLEDAEANLNAAAIAVKAAAASVVNATRRQ